MKYEKNGHYGGQRANRMHHRGPKTFRRGRAIAFLQMMQVKRSTIKQQLEEPEFESVRQILVGELKAIDMVINEFIQLFDIHESEASDRPLEKDDEKGIESNETN